MTNLHFTDSGKKGDVIMLIHGFPVHQQMWDDFAARLSTSFRVITIDLPGFGGSAPLPSSSFTIDDVANHILAWMATQKLENITVVGHSLGGYVALAMVNIKPDIFNGLVLFHSTAYADNDEKKQSRNKVLDFIAKNGVLAFTAGFVSPLYADPNHPSIEKVKTLAMQASQLAVTGYTAAMRDRPDRTHVLKEFPRPVLFIAGEKDSVITPDSISKQAPLNAQAEVRVIRGVGHMGMLENPVETLEAVKQFALKVTGGKKK